MLLADTILQERYKVIRSVGHGGMGAVYLAKDLRLGSVVALKENFFNDEKMIKAFEHEARLLAGLRHVALPKVFDHFSVGEGQFLVMEYIYGDDFVEMLEKRKKLIEPAGQPKPFEVHEVLPWAEQLLDALDYIHTQQYPIIHRDIKPQNLKLARRNQIILLDFGLAKGNSSQTSIKSTSGSLLGYTPNYAPIEQIQGAGTDPRTDLYSLGATFYHLLTGMAPIASAIRAEAFLGGEEDPLRPPRMFNPKIPPGLSDLIMKALQQHRNNRPPSAAEMLKMLRAITHPMVEDRQANKQADKYKTTVVDLKKAAEIQNEQQERARQEKIEADRQRQLEEEAKRSREEADTRRRKLEEKLRQAQKESEQLRQREARAQKARQEAEDFRKELEEQTREAIEDVERRVLLEEQARKSREENEQRKRQEEWIRRAQEAEAQEREHIENIERIRQGEERQRHLGEQARQAREEEQRQLQAQEQARQAREEAERLRRELEEHARKAQEEAERRMLHEQEARQAREEAQRLKQQEQERQAREEAERRKLQEELERRVKGEAEMQKALQDWEQMARQEAERKRLLEEQMQQATEEAQHLKELLQEQTLKASQEAQKRQALEEQADKAAQEAQKRKLLEEQARQATEEAEQLRRQEQERRVREDSEKKRLQDEGAHLAREEGKRLKQLENLALIAAQESEMFKRQLEEQARRAEIEAEKRRQLEEEVREAERRLVEEQERNAENGRREEAAASWNQTRELIAWDGMKEGKPYLQQNNAPFYLQPNEPSILPITERKLFIQSLEEKTPDRTKWIVAGAIVITLAILVIVRIVVSTSTTNQNVETNLAITSLISADSYVQIQAGSFMMGSDKGVKDEKPAHKVILTRGFEMGKYEVTQEQWEAVMGSNPSKFRGANLPVDNISWSDIKGFIDKVSKKDASHIYRLPTEAEWEYACRSGSATETPANLDSVAWYQKNSENLTHPVGQKQANAWGLYDMIGNVFEYCQDYYLENYYSYYKDENSMNPPGPPDGTLYSFRGGNYASPVENCRPATRWGAKPTEKIDRAGFRLARQPR